jgi:3-hydroxyisobutyrate dehydrogenase-like beta-hydroxyacid dehydrogenase
MADGVATTARKQRFGFIGLGVMGEPMCRNLARRDWGVVTAYDRDTAPLDRLAAAGVAAAPAVADVAARSDVIFMALPSGTHVEAVCDGPQGLIAHAGPRHIVVDLGTSPVDLTRTLAQRFAARGARYADAPIARTRQAAEQGTLSIMVGSDATTFGTLEPLLRAFATDVTHCGDVGAGQVVKLMNNMVLVQTVTALAEALATARRAGVDGEVLFDALMKGSADSFALRNHGAKAMLVDNFPERAFSTHYALKDIDYALELARAQGLTLSGAENAKVALQRAVAQGDGDRYWPVIYRAIAASGGA